MRIFQCIITAERERQFAKFSKTKKPKSDSKPERWPLHLPAVQHALIASTLSSITKPLSQEMDGQAELLLCNSFLNSIEDFVGDLSLLPPAEMRPMSQESNNKKPSLHFSDHILMSLRDARLFTLALGKLSHIDQKRMLTKLIDILHNGLHTANVKSRALEMITLKVEASRFIARVITLCASLVDIISSPELFQLIAAEIGSTHYSLPRIKQKMTPGTERCCFSKEECFQGLFADWESPLVPVAEISFTGILQESEFKKLEEVLQSALGVGFKASSQDGCHILSSSWNAAAKLSSWTSLSWEGPAAPSTIKQCSFVQRMMKLRDEMCEVHYLVNGQDGSTPPDTLLTKIVQNKRSHCRPNEAIIEGLSASEHMLANLTLEVSKLKLRKDLPPLPSFAYYEALPLYVSFLISMHTLPGSNDMGSTHRFEKSLPRRKKTSGYTDDDDIMENLLGEDSDDSNCSVELDNNDSENTSRINALSHLHDACITLGAAPCYPDWLDANCRMREGMNPPIAVDSADRALSSLMQFGTAVFKCYAQSLQHALNILELGASQDHFSASSSIALKLIFVRPQTPNDVFDSLTSSLCQISSSALKLVTKTLTSQLCSSSNDFCLKSVHRIIGAAMNEGWEAAPGEHRANGQWETLVSETLEGSSLRVAPDAIAEAISYDANVLEDIATALVTVCRWRRVLYSIVSAMVPTTALLRFGVNDAKGRKPHSLCEGLSGSRFSHSSENNEGGTQRFSTKNQVGTTIKNVLSFLSCISAHSANDVNMHLTARAAADHLLEDCSQFHDLESLWKVRIQFEAISGVLHGLENEHIIESQKASASTIIEMMLGMNNGVSVDKEKLYLLLSCFGMKSVRFGRLIGNRANVDLTDILAACGTTMDLFVENEVPGLFKQWGSIQTNVAHLLINLLCQGKAQLQASSRSFVTSLMNDLMEAENCFLKEKGPGNGVILRYAVASSLDELSKDDILRLVDDICLISSTTKVAVSNTESEKKELSEKLAIFINYLASVPRSADGCEIILNSLLSCMDKWANSSAHDHVMNLTCTLASRFGELHQVGKRILTLTTNTISEQPNLVNAVKVFFQFVVSLDKIVNHSQCSKPLQPSIIQSSGKSNDRDAKKGSCYTLKGGADILRTCSYVNTGESFSEQHWYNCYTCGLLWDKVCCSFLIIY